MPSTGIVATATPQDVVDALSLAVGTQYDLQNESASEVLLAEAASAPDASFQFWRRVGEKETKIIVPADGQGIWVKTRNSTSAIVSINNRG